MRYLIPVAVALALCAASAQAGVVVFKNGKVVVGKIPVETDTPEKLVIQKPVPLQKDERGEMEVLKAEIRWYDREADAPTNAYWEKHAEEPIADEWAAARERWKNQQATEAELKKLSTSGDPSKESAEVATTPDEKKAAPPAPAEPAPAEPAPAAPGESAPATPATPAPAPSGGGWCSLAGPRTGGSPLGLLALAAALLLLGRARR